MCGYYGKNPAETVIWLCAAFSGHISGGCRSLPYIFRKGEKMNYEKSCGAIVYRKHHGNTEILLARNIKSGHWSFPKGHMEEGETEEETARREIKEETGLDVLLDTGFRETVTYSPKRNTKKTVVYFVAIPTSHELVPPKGRDIGVKMAGNRTGVRSAYL